MSMRGSVVVRELGAADAGAFQALRLRGLAECPSAFAASHDEECGRPVAEIADRLRAEPGRCVLGAFRDAGLVGCLGVDRERKRKLSHKAFLWGMYVAPEARRAGAGGALVAAALRRARAMAGVRQVTLGVNAANAPALALYERMGFLPYGVERGFLLVDGVLHDEVLMACALG